MQRLIMFNLYVLLQKIHGDSKHILEFRKCKFN